MKFSLDVQPIVVEAGSVEDALSKLSFAVSVLARHAGNGVDVAAAGWVAVSEAPEDAAVTDLRAITAPHYPTAGPTPPELLSEEL